MSANSTEPHLDTQKLETDVPKTCVQLHHSVIALDKSTSFMSVYVAPIAPIAAQDLAEIISVCSDSALLSILLKGEACQQHNNGFTCWI